MKIYKGGKLIRKRQIILLKKEPTSGFKKIGTASGHDLFHCINTAGRFASNFAEDVRAYWISEIHEPHKIYAMSVTFYKKA